MAALCILGFRVITPIMENQMEKKNENRMEATASRVFRGYIGIVFLLSYHIGTFDRFCSPEILQSSERHGILNIYTGATSSP